MRWNRRKPFDSGGRDGYRDALLWETVIDLARDYEVILVSADARAFAGDNGELASVLAAEVVQRAGAEASVALVGDTRDVVIRLNRQTQATLAYMQHLVRQRSFAVLLDEGLDEALAIFPLARSEWQRLAPHPTVKDAWVRSLDEMGTITVAIAFTVAGEDALVELQVLCSLEVAFVAGGVAAFELLGSTTWAEEEVAVWDASPSSNEAITLNTRRLARVRVEIAVNLRTGRLERLEVRAVALAGVDVEFTLPAVDDSGPLDP